MNPRIVSAGRRLRAAEVALPVCDPARRDPGHHGPDVSDRLQELESEGILERTVIPDTPVRVEYSLTKKGCALAVAFDAIADWAHKWTGDEPVNAPSAPDRPG